jgi:hypothetical protein
MNNNQRNEVIKYINEDCDIRHKYLNDDGQTCALGYLALKAGVDKLTLLAAGPVAISWAEDNGSPIDEIYKHIKSRFGLLINQQNIIQQLNDKGLDPSERRKTIVEYVSSIVI